MRKQEGKERDKQKDVVMRLRYFGQRLWQARSYLLLLRLDDHNFRLFSAVFKSVLVNNIRKFLEGEFFKISSDCVSQTQGIEDC